MIFFFYSGYRGSEEFGSCTAILLSVKRRDFQLIVITFIEMPRHF